MVTETNPSFTVSEIPSSGGVEVTHGVFSARTRQPLHIVISNKPVFWDILMNGDRLGHYSGTHPLLFIMRFLRNIQEEYAENEEARKRTTG